MNDYLERPGNSAGWELDIAGRENGKMLEAARAGLGGTMPVGLDRLWYVEGEPPKIMATPLPPDSWRASNHTTYPSRTGLARQTAVRSFFEMVRSVCGIGCSLGMMPRWRRDGALG